MKLQSTVKNNEILGTKIKEKYRIFPNVQMSVYNENVRYLCAYIYTLTFIFTNFTTTSTRFSTLGLKSVKLKKILNSNNL